MPSPTKPLRGALAFALFVLGSAPLSAQERTSLVLPGEDGLVDRVAAVVGDSVILESQVLERILDLQTRGLDVPDDPEARASVRHEVTENMVDEQLVIQAALEDSTLVVDEERVDELVSQDMDQRVRSFGSQQALREALQDYGMTLAEYRETRRTEVRRLLLHDQYLARRQGDATTIPISDSEMREFFEQNREMIGERPASITFERISLRPRASEEEMARARAEAEAVLDSLRSGEADFEELARNHSDDPGSRDQGGSLGWFRRDQMVQSFEDAVFSLREGETSGVVESQYGFHIIRVDRIRGSERRARHILISPEVTQADVEAMRARARALVDSLRSGTPVDSLQARYSADEQVDPVTIPRDQLTSLPSGYLEPLRNARPGDVLGPIEWGSQGQTNVDVVEVEDVRDAGEFTFEEMQPQIRQRLQQDKLLERIYAELRDQTYVDVRL